VMTRGNCWIECVSEVRGGDRLFAAAAPFAKPFLVLVFLLMTGAMARALFVCWIVYALEERDRDRLAASVPSGTPFLAAAPLW